MGDIFLMDGEVVKKHSVWLNILKVVSIILLSIVLLVVGVFLYLRFYLGIDFGKIKTAIDLINKPYVQGEIITNSYNDDDTYMAFYKLYGDNQVYVLDGEEYVFDKQEFSVAILQGDTNLNIKELAGVLNLYFKEVVAESLNAEEVNKNISLKQISFLDFDEDENSLFVNIKFSFELRIYDSGEGDLITSIVKNFIPKKIYVTSTVTLTISKTNCFDYSFIENSFVINNLSIEETDKIFDVFSSFGIGVKEETVSEINNVFCGLIFGNEKIEGLVEYIVQANGFDFVESGEDILFCIKKV